MKKQTCKYEGTCNWNSGSQTANNIVNLGVWARGSELTVRTEIGKRVPDIDIFFGFADCLNVTANGSAAVFCPHGNKTSSYIHGGEFLD